MSEATTPARPVLPTEQKDYVTLREFEQRMSELQKLYDERTRYEREILSTRENSLNKALELQAIEMLRRLDELNRAHATAMENWRTSLPRELFEQWKEDHVKWRETVTLTLVQIRDIHPLAQRVQVIEVMGNKLTGALLILSAMGVAGVVGLILGLARLAGFVQ